MERVRCRVSRQNHCTERMHVGLQMAAQLDIEEAGATPAPGRPEIGPRPRSAIFTPAGTFTPATSRKARETHALQPCVIDPRYNTGGNTPFINCRRWTGADLGLAVSLHHGRSPRREESPGPWRTWLRSPASSGARKVHPLLPGGASAGRPGLVGAGL